jgi:ribosomal 50S subunit-associated protein YjgA (DUF615 family)
MNRELEALILAYERVSALRDEEAKRALEVFDGMVDEIMNAHPALSRDTLRRSIIRQHRKWALAQEKKPAAIPPKA